eukprot:gb/GEZN01001794.1/.p1 GENE.gb/GEZN01001794.1/~~gb/GEZN01001794.1/.p1  ORF type:complete len:877 (+),score=112.48 gb/GEZN01001794.1/:93-2723(+)
MALSGQQSRMNVVPGEERVQPEKINLQEQRLITIPTKQSQMFWLYEMIGITGTKPVFGPYARAWLKERYAMADLSSRPLRHEEKWWEFTVNQDTARFLQSEGESSEPRNNMGEDEKEGRLPRPSSMNPTSGGVRGAAQLAKYNVTLDTIMKDQRYRSEFYDYLEENYQNQYLDFLEQVDLWKSKCFGPEAKKSGKFDVKAFLAKNVFEQYIDEGSENPIALETAHRQEIETAVANASRLVKGTFDKACNTVNQFLTEEMLPSFAETEEFRELFSGKDEVENPSNSGQKRRGSGENSPRESKADVHNIAGGAAGALTPNFDDTSGLENDLDSMPLLPKAKPWLNYPTYRSIIVTILDSREPQPKKRYNAHISVDSKTVSTPVIKMTMPGADWNFTVHLPLENTTQWLTIQLLSEKVLLGTQVIQIADLYAAMEDESEEGQLVRKEGKWWPMDFLPKGSPAELQLKLALSTSHLSEAQVEALEKMQILPESMAKKGTVSNKIRGKVSKKKLRFKEDGYDLDLTYITPRLLAMGYPSEGVEGAYRNSLKDVQSFFTRRHPQAYRLYNLCSERKYDPTKFQNSVIRYPFDDHNPPPFEMMPEFCEDLRRWLTEHPQHVAAIHCKAGKGRTGTMIAAYLLYVGHSPIAKEALDFFAERRTKNHKGVTIPSQARFVKYFANYCKLKREGKAAPGRTTLFLSKIVMHGIPKATSGDFFFILKQNGGAVQRPKYDSNKLVPASVDKVAKKIIWDLTKLLIPVEENFLIVFKAKKPITGQQEKFAQCWLNTRWEDLDKDAEDQDPYIVIPKSQLDKACKDVKKHKLFDENFAIQIFFSETPISGRVKELELAGKFNAVGVASASSSLMHPAVQPGAPLLRAPGQQ